MLYQITELSAFCALAAIVFIHVSGSGKIHSDNNVWILLEPLTHVHVCATGTTIISVHNDLVLVPRLVHVHVHVGTSTCAVYM